MTENLLDTFHEEMLNRLPYMTDAVQYYFVRLSHKLWDQDRPLKEDEKIIAIFHVF